MRAGVATRWLSAAGSDETSVACTAADDGDISPRRARSTSRARRMCARIYRDVRGALLHRKNSARLELPSILEVVWQLIAESTLARSLMSFVRCPVTLGPMASAVSLLLASANPAAGQGYPASQRARVDQTVAFTEISVMYGRPVARGRTLFGGDSALVRWDDVWHPGADSATRVSFSHDVKLEGHDVKAGEYSLWLIPRANAPWTVILSRAAHVFHKPYPGESSDAYRFDVTPE